MHLFYHPNISETCTLSEEESTHAIRVLRLKNGDEISLIDGKGGFFKARIIEANTRKCVVKVSDKLPIPNSPPRKLSGTESAPFYESGLAKRTVILRTESPSDQTTNICEFRKFALFAALAYRQAGSHRFAWLALLYLF
mgnify:CR=1 FL=1